MSKRSVDSRSEKPVVFLFPGQGSQYFQMGRELYHNVPRFQHWMNKLDAIVLEKAGFSVVEKLYQENRPRSEPFNDLSRSHPAIVLVELALAKTLIEAGIEPDYLFGSSLGEFTASALAESVDIETLFDLVIHQGAELHTTDSQFGMTAVLLAKERLVPIINTHNCEIAGENSESHFVIAGHKNDLAGCHTEFQKLAVSYQPLSVDQAFHSSFLDSVKSKVYPFITRQQYYPLNVPLYSCARGEQLHELPMDHFWNVIRQPIHFVNTLKRVEELAPCIFIDLGPSSTLTNFAKMNMANHSDSEFYSIMDPFGSDLERLELLLKIYGDIKMDKFEPRQKKNQSQRVYLFPGQGSQYAGMGRELFAEFPGLVMEADSILGYSIEELCVTDPDKKLGQTQFTQPALYVVEVLSYLRECKHNSAPDVVAGHSLGEYAALFAAGVFNFATGLTLVKQRGALMAQAKVNGGMAAVLNYSADQITALFRKGNLLQIDIANFNKPTQIVIAGPLAELKIAERLLVRAGATYIPLNVSAPFHSRYMEPTVTEFLEFLGGFEFAQPKIPVISNVTARPYQHGGIKDLLAKQICNPVRWTESIQYLMGQADFEYQEIGPGDVLTKLVTSICETCEPIKDPRPLSHPGKTEEGAEPDNIKSKVDNWHSSIIGDDSGFTKVFGCASNYVIGALDVKKNHKVISDAAAAGVLSYAALPDKNIEEIRSMLISLSATMDKNRYGIRFKADIVDPEKESAIADILIQEKVQHVEAAGFWRPSLALVKLRLKTVDTVGNSSLRLLVRTDNVETAKSFLQPPPEKLVSQLLRTGEITLEEAELAAQTPMADAIAYSGEWLRLQHVLQMRADVATGMSREFRSRKVFIGSANAIGSPMSISGAVTCGAEFVLADSIYQCTAESSLDEESKILLQTLDESDVVMAPCEELFEFGHRVPVVAKNSNYAQQANLLFNIWKAEASIDSLSAKAKEILAEKFFPEGLDNIWREISTKQKWFTSVEVSEAEKNQKLKLTLLFKYYLRSFANTQSDSALIHCGHEMAEFNRWLNKNGVIAWQQRQVSRIVKSLIEEARKVVERSGGLESGKNAGVA